MGKLSHFANWDQWPIEKKEIRNYYEVILKLQKNVIGTKSMSIKILIAAVYSNTSEVMFEELGICSLAAFLRKNGYEVMLICAREDQIDYAKIKSFGPGMIGVTVYYYSKQAVYDFCRKVLEDVPGARICAGGYLPTYYDVRMLQEAPFIDFVIRGEGEISFLNLLQRLEKGEDLNGLKGLTFRSGEEIVTNEDQPLIEDLDSLPLPARDLLTDNNLKVASIMTSRGCARKCSFCNTANFWKKWRGRDVRDMLEEIKYIHTLGIRYFSFNDSSFEDSITHMERIVSLARGILDLNLDISYIAGFRAEFNRDATPELMELLKRSGLRQVRIGIESANEFDRRLFGKWASLDDNCKIIELFKAYNIYPRVGFINFNPYSTFEGLNRNIDYLEKYGWANNFYTLSSRLTVFKGTGLYKKVKCDGLMLKEDSDSPQYKFKDTRIPHLVNYLQSYFYLLDSQSNGAIRSFCNYRNYFQSIIYDFRERFGKERESVVSQLVDDFGTDINSILDNVNRITTGWFRELLKLAENGWDNKAAFQMSSVYLNKKFLLETVTELEEKKSIFSRKLQSAGPEYKEWIQQTWDTIGNLEI
jgi:anaerobic magnesium-protoporphyrin IX monomethyl ester cyclase